MIVTSKRCFLNKFIQRNTVETVLNANYYIGDKAKTNASVNPNIVRNEYGEIEEVSSTYTFGSSDNFGSSYHVRYAKILNPEPYNAEYVMGETDGFSCAEERYINHLQHEDTMIRTFDFLFGAPLQGNGLQILIFEDDENVKKFGHILCQFLSMTFGVDIIFIDPAFRPDCRGVTTYTGNKQQGMINSKLLSDRNTISRFNQALSQSEYHHSLSNVREFLDSFTGMELMEIYNLLFPNAPLPQGNYTDDQLREIIIYHTTSGKVIDSNALSNVLIQHDWDHVTSRMSNEEYDFSIDDTGLF